MLPLPAAARRVRGPSWSASLQIESTSAPAFEWSVIFSENRFPFSGSCSPFGEDCHRERTDAIGLLARARLKAINPEEQKFN
jgi:hypothetical protein